MQGHRFPYKWVKADLKRVKKHGHRVFSTFACGGGSSFGYKMAGFDVVGCNEIDKEMMELYAANHRPKLAYEEPIQAFKAREDLPAELFDMDVLDGSPPCSTFSTAGGSGGGRKARWGKERKFKEGQKKQVLSDLFFDYLDVVAKLRPKVSIAENVKGLMMGKARGYCKLIVDRYGELGYDVQMFLLNAAKMGVPQLRERVFFVARRRDLALPPLALDFDEAPIPFRDVCAALPFQDLDGTALNRIADMFWGTVPPGKMYCTVAKKSSYYSTGKLSMSGVARTLCSSMALIYPTEKRFLSWIESCLIGSYPYDYDFLGKGSVMKSYVIGMSVPPVMMAQIAARIAEQWFGVGRDKLDAAWKGVA